MVELAAAQTAFAKVSMSSPEQQAPANGLHPPQPPALSAFAPLTAPAAVTRLQQAGSGIDRHDELLLYDCNN